MNRVSRPAVAGLVLILSALPGLVSVLRKPVTQALALRRVPYAQRRARVNGAIQQAAVTIDRTFPPDEPVRVVMHGIKDIDRVVFLDYYLYPRVTRVYWSLDEYRIKAIDPRGDIPLAYIDVRRDDGARVMTYAQIRQEQVHETPPFVAPIPPESITDAIVPFAVAYDGAPPDAYITTVALSSDADGTVTLTFEPSGRATTIALRAGEPRIIEDVVYDCFGSFTTGWIHIAAKTPFRVGAWLVNRGRNRSAAIPIVTRLPPVPRDLAGGDHLWLLNPDSVSTNVVVNEALVVVAPRALLNLPAQPHYSIRDSGPLVIFSTRKLADGNTEFVTR